MQKTKKKKITIISRVEEDDEDVHDKEDKETSNGAEAAEHGEKNLEVENVTFVGRFEETEAHDKENLLENKSGGLKTIIEAAGQLPFKTNVFEVCT